MAPAGRPKIGKKARTRVNVMLDPAIHTFLKDYGDGNVSKALHEIVTQYINAEMDLIQKKGKK